MAYQVLARKWRPQDFSSLIGQGPIVTALSNALTEGRVAQAYIFSGIRGVGKTSAARLLAKALNCERGPTAEPCNACPPCREIAAGADLDVVEVDAATYSKVEQVRELTESLRYAPARDRYKVVVIDEIHRLSRQAFDALLKIVEEPPPHLVFVFATTEIEAVPATVLSRCQEFRFRRVAVGELSAHLRRISDDEGIEVSDAALRMIARAGEGSVRDSVALLDQLATFGSGAIRDEDAAQLFGGLDSALFAGLLAAVTAGQRAEVSAVVQRIEEDGWDPRYAYARFLAYCRDALHLALGGDTGGVDLPREEASRLAEIAAGAGYENLLRLLHLLLASEASVRRSEAGALAVEIAWLRAAELPKLTRIEEILAGGGAPRATAAEAPAATSSPADGRATAPRPAAAAPAAATPAREAPPPPPPEEIPQPAAGDPPPVEGEEPAPEAPAPRPRRRAAAATAEEARPGDPEGNVAALLEEVSRLKPPLAAFLGGAARLTFEAGELLIATPPGERLLADALKRRGNREALAAALTRICGEGVGWRLVAAGEERPAAEPPPPAADGGEEHPMVQAVLEIFSGTVQSDERQGGSQED